MATLDILPLDVCKVCVSVLTKGNFCLTVLGLWDFFTKSLYSEIKARLPVMVKCYKARRSTNKFSNEALIYALLLMA